MHIAIEIEIENIKLSLSQTHHTFGVKVDVYG